jgi:hypothetical protein
MPPKKSPEQIVKKEKKKKRVYDPIKAKEYRTKRDAIQKEAMIQHYHELAMRHGYDEY